MAIREAEGIEGTYNSTKTKITEDPKNPLGIRKVVKDRQRNSKP